MELRCDESEERFCTELRAWLAESLPSLGPRPAPGDFLARRAYDTRWQRALHDAGYAGIHWPREFGGRGATPAEHLIFLEETVRAGAPAEGVNFVGLLHAGPTLIAEGTDAQRRRHLPAILRGEEVWCQGFSEPGAGSDLAAISTRAVRDGDHYVVTGQKVWTSYATVANQCELLVRTDPDAPKHHGLTWLIMPMDANGVEVRPLETIDGTDEFAELFLDDVRIPVENRVGAEHDGWQVAMVTFGFERGTALVSRLLEWAGLLDELVAFAQATPARAGSTWDDVGVRRELATVAAELDGLWAMTRRNVTKAGRGVIQPTAASVFKLAFAEAAHRLAQLTIDVLGPAAAARSALAGKATHRLLDAATYSFVFAIAAGTSQIQRNIIATRGLGLPRVDR